MGKRKYTHYAKPELVEQVNPENKRIWQRYLNGKRTLSESSRNGYESDINQFFTYILLNYDNKYLLDFETDEAADMIDDFIAMCQSVFENKDKRIARRLSSISSLYMYYKKKRKITENPVELLDRPKIQKGKYEIKQTFLTLEQVDLIREKLAELNSTQLTLFFELGLYSMARVNALSSITLKQIDINNKRIERVIEKEGYEVTLMFDERCKELIQKWLKEREEQGIETDLLFYVKHKDGYNNAKGAMQQTWIKKIGAFIDEEELHVHDLRHSGSNLKYAAGMSLEMVSKALNHRSTQVTSDHYLQMNYDKLQSDMEKYSH